MTVNSGIIYDAIKKDNFFYMLTRAHLRSAAQSAPSLPRMQTTLAVARVQVVIVTIEYGMSHFHVNANKFRLPKNPWRLVNLK